MRAEVVTSPNIWIGDDNKVELIDLRLEQDDTYIPNATVTASLYTAAAVLLDTVTLTWIVGTRGRYYGIIPASTTELLTLRQQYEIRVTAILDTSRLTASHWRVAEYRGQY